MNSIRVLSVVSLFSCFVLICVGQETGNSDDASTARQRLETKMAELQGLISQNGGCDAQICFALQSSNPPGFERFQLQKAFVLSAARTFFNNQGIFRAGAIKYGIISSSIVLPNVTLPTFVEEVRDAQFEESDDSSLAAPIVTCDVQLDPPAAVSQNRYTVLFNNGQSDFGGPPAVNAEIFEGRGGRIFGITFQKEQRSVLRAALADKVTAVEYLPDFWRIRFVLESLVRTVCNFPRQD